MHQVIILKKIVTIWDKLLQNNISVFRVTNDNGRILRKFSKEIGQDAFDNNYEFLILRFCCTAHTCQLFIDDLKKKKKNFLLMILYI